MTWLQQLLSALPTVAASWPALIGYVAVVISFTAVSLKVTRNKNLLDRLQSLPEVDRARVVHMEMGEAYLATGLSPAQWLQQQRQRYYFIAFLVASVLGVSLVIAASWRTSLVTPDAQAAEQRARETASQLVGLVQARDFDGAYDILPDEVKRNISFAQAQADLTRTTFQLPPKPLRQTVEQVVATGGNLFVFVISEFSIETKIRNVLMFSKIGPDWKLWSYNWQPFEWPLVWPSATEIRATAAEVMKTYQSLPVDEQQIPLPNRFRGNITGSAPGWHVIVETVQNAHDASRCTVATHESESNVLVSLKDVVGGCFVKPGQRILVNAIFSAVDKTHIELEAVRYFPES